MLEIQSNGSKWAGQEPDSVEVLLGVLAKEPLDKTYEDFYYPLEQDFCERHNYPEGTIAFSGNFLNYSHVFNIRTDELSLIKQLTQAIEANKQMAAYVNQKLESRGIK